MSLAILTDAADVLDVVPDVRHGAAGKQQVGQTLRAVAVHGVHQRLVRVAHLRLKPPDALPMAQHKHTSGIDCTKPPSCAAQAVPNLIKLVLTKAVN